MKTSKIIALGLALILVVATRLSAQYPCDADTLPLNANMDVVKDAGNQAIGEALTELLSRKNVPKRFAVLPVVNDIEGDYFATQVRNQFTSIGSVDGYKLYTRMDHDWQSLLNEIEWGQKFADTMDTATIQKFGRIQGVQGLLTAKISGISRTEDNRIKVRVSLQAFEVETGRQLWGQEKVGLMNEKTDFLNTMKPRQVFLFLQWLKPPFIVVMILVVLFLMLQTIKRAARAR